ncbi:MAG TPA: hypothetical protein VNG90_01405, partial [Candidatus Acidoferrum sp.]|nr:hypothetical protein [Candidatus Acidoferrum sp.]
KRGITVDIYRLLVALEVGDNPLPALEAPNHKRKLRILATPDCSGSTQGWNGLGQAWALHLAKLPDVEVVYAANFNGQFFELSSDKATTELIESVDLVLYLGDHDGRQMCEHYASLGATVVALDSYSASVAKPRLATSMALGQGTLYWVDRVSAKEPATWAKAVELCLSR